MTIHLPDNLKTPILEAVSSGRYASMDDAMTEAASLLVERLKQEQAAPSPAAGHDQVVPAEKPIWEEILDLTADVPDDDWDRLPTDLAEQHDHYIYDTPKRTSSS